MARTRIAAKTATPASSASSAERARDAPALEPGGSCIVQDRHEYRRQDGDEEGDQLLEGKEEQHQRRDQQPVRKATLSTAR